MAYVLSSLSGNLISAASAGFAPTNSADVSSIASAYAADKQDASAMSAYALSSNVSSVIDTVSSNSASWGGGGSTIATGEFLGYTVVSADNGVSVVGNSGVVSSSVSVPYTDTTWKTNTISANSNKSQFRIYNFSRTDGNMPSLPTGKSVRIRVTASSNLQNVYSDDQIHLIVYTGTNSGSPIGNWQVQSVQGYRSAIWDKTVTWNSTNQPNMLITAENFNTYVFSTTALYSAVGTGASASESSYTADILAASPSYVSSVVSGVIDTVSSNSANWGGGGGVDSATVSAIASSYAESAVSSKLDASASSDFYSTSNPSGFLTGIDLSDYATTAYVDSSISSFVDSAYVESQVSGKQDELTFGYSGMFISSINGSAIYDTQATGEGVNSATVSAIASSYAESAASSKQDASAMSSYVLSADVSGVIDTVSSNSASWGGGGGGGVDSATVSAIASAYADPKLDISAIECTPASAITAIGGSAIAGGGGGASIPFTGYYYDSSTSATVAITADVTAVSSLSYAKYDGTVVNAYKGITDSNGIHHLGVASFIEAGAEINGKNAGDIPYTMEFAPGTSMWTTAGAATGIFAPLQYGTGAGMFLDNSNFKGYLKGNEWFVSNTLYGYARGEVHKSRGSRVIVEHTGGAGAVLSAKGRDANVTLNSTAYGTAKMAVGTSQAYVQVQRGDSASKYNSAKLDTDYLKFYAGMTTGYLDPDDTASGTAYMPAETEYMYISSIPYWNAKVDQSAYDNLYSAFTALSDIISTYSAYFSSISAKVDNSAIGVSE